MQRALKNARMPCSFGKHLAKSVKRVGYGHLANTGLACPILGVRGFRVSGLGIYSPELQTKSIVDPEKPAVDIDRAASWVQSLGLWSWH